MSQLSKDSEREQLERALRERNDQLVAANKEFELLSHAVSHDLRAPLRALEGFAQIVAEDFGSNLTPEGKRCVEILASSAHKASLLIDDLLLLIRYCRRPMRPATVNMANVARRKIEEIQLEPISAKFQLTPMPGAWGDEDFLGRIWEELLRNAVKFSAQQKQPLIELGGRNEPERLVYYIKDNGAGFDMKYASRLGGIFQRLHTEQQFEGRGIGMAVVQRLVQRHGGELWAEGKTDGGATFYFSLPLPERLKELLNLRQ